jgi:hypothetical protein
LVVKAYVIMEKAVLLGILTMSMFCHCVNIIINFTTY